MKGGWATTPGAIEPARGKERAVGQRHKPKTIAARNCHEGEVGALLPRERLGGRVEEDCAIACAVLADHQNGAVVARDRVATVHSPPHLSLDRLPLLRRRAPFLCGFQAIAVFVSPVGATESHNASIRQSSEHKILARRPHVSGLCPDTRGWVENLRCIREGFAPVPGTIVAPDIAARCHDAAVRHRHQAVGAARVDHRRGHVP